MNLRPRVREWLPLSTQQLRLRNLVKIQGYNIKCGCNDETLLHYIHYSLHSDKDGVAFYTSEELPHHRQQKWAEINASDEMLLKSNSNCLCIKVWARLVDVSKKPSTKTKHATDEFQNEDNGKLQSKEPKSALLTKQFSNICLAPHELPRPPEKLLFTWGVYFSGLVPVTQLTDAKFRDNCLIFQMNGEYFTAPKYLTTDGLREQLSQNYNRFASRIPKHSLSTSNENEYSINSPQASRSASPLLGWDNQTNLLNMCKIRYNQLDCSVNEVRKSYNLDKLLKLQRFQRLRLQKTRESLDIASEIKLLCVHCITRNELRNKPRTTSISSLTQHYQHHQQYHSMGRTLSVLLAEQERLDPVTLYAAQRLQTQLETLRCKQRLLQVEHAAYAKRIQQQRERLALLTESREQICNQLARYRAELEVERIQLIGTMRQYEAQKETKQKIMQHMKRRMSTLCMELSEIYNIGRHGNFYTICGIPLPNIEAYISDAKYANSVGLEVISPLALSAALGYVAHLVQMIAVILNRALRNPIVYETSRSRIMDVIENIPYTSREFPLYTRSIIPSKPEKHAIYLLNQNISELCYDITGKCKNTYATMKNIKHIFNVLADIEQSQSEIRAECNTHPTNRLVLPPSDDDYPLAICRDLSTNENDSAQHVECLSNSHSSVDINHVPVPLPIPAPSIPSTSQMANFLQLLPTGTEPVGIAGYTTTQRVCRSVGSYSDSEDDFKNIIDHAYTNSDSHLTVQSEPS